jgi:hypothetical protein
VLYQILKAVVKSFPDRKEEKPSSFVYSSSSSYVRKKMVDRWSKRAERDFSCCFVIFLISS